jgi:hypothetical protein
MRLTRLVKTQQALENKTAAPAKEKSAQGLQQDQQDPLANVLQMQEKMGNRATAAALQPGRQAVVQRLKTDEGYYFHKLDNNVNAAFSIFLAKPEWKRFLAQIRQYSLLTSGKANRRMAGTLLARMNTLQGAIADLEGAKTQYETAFSAKYPNMEVKTKGKFDRAKEAIRNAIDTAQDDVSDEMQAMIQIKDDPTIDNSGYSWQQVLMFTRMGVPLNQLLTENQLAPGTDGKQAGNPKELGGGQISKPVALNYQNADGTSERRVFKGNEIAAPSAHVGLDVQNINTTYRAVASGRVEGLIQQAMNAANRPYRLLLGKVSVGSYGGKAGTVTDFAKGHDAMETELSDSGAILSQGYVMADPNDINLHRDAANLQLLDAITDQMDRHMGNMKVSTSSTGGQLTGIDNDFAFGQERTGTESDSSATKNRFPKFVDQYFAEAVLSITDADFLKALQGISQREITAAVQRFKAIKTALLELQRDGKLVTMPNDPNKQNGQMTWADIRQDMYNKAANRWDVSDYGFQLFEAHSLVVEAIRKNPNITPQKINGKWTIRIDAERYAYSTKTDGSDLWDLVNEIRAEANPWKRADARRGKGALFGSHRKK